MLQNDKDVITLFPNELNQLKNSIIRLQRSTIKSRNLLNKCGCEVSRSSNDNDRVLLLTVTSLDSPFTTIYINIDILYISYYILI